MVPDGAAIAWCTPHTKHCELLQTQLAKFSPNLPNSLLISSSATHCSWGFWLMWTGMRPFLFYCFVSQITIAGLIYFCFQWGKNCFRSRGRRWGCCLVFKFHFPVLTNFLYHHVPSGQPVNASTLPSLPCRDVGKKNTLKITTGSVATLTRTYWNAQFMTDSKQDKFLLT